MAMLKKISRLFTIKTRFEAWLVIYAIALGSVERGQSLSRIPTLVGADGCLQPPAPVWSSSRARSFLILVRPMKPAVAVGIYLRAAAASLRSMVVIDPGACRPVMFQGHRFHLAEIDVYSR